MMPATCGYGIAVGSGVAVGLGVAVGTGVDVGSGVAVGTGVEVGAGVAVGATMTSGSCVAVGTGGGSGSSAQETIASNAETASNVARILRISFLFKSSPHWVYSIEARALLRASSNTKKGAPTSAVTTPTGISAGAIATRASVSAASRKMPPPSALNGISTR